MAGEEHGAPVRPPLGPDGYRDLDDGETFVLVRRWMWRDLNLAGVTLLVFARVWSFCREGAGEFYESKPRTAEVLGVSEREVYRAFSALTGRGLVVEVGRTRSGAKRYRADARLVASIRAARRG